MVHYRSSFVCTPGMIFRAGLVYVDVTVFPDFTEGGYANGKFHELLLLPILLCTPFSTYPHRQNKILNCLIQDEAKAQGTVIDGWPVSVALARAYAFRPVIPAATANHTI